MCGRYTLSSPADLIADLFGLVEVPELAPRYNIAPTQEAPVVRVLDEPVKGGAGEGAEAGRRRLDLLRWGLVPFWADDPKIGNRMINARAESVATKPAFRQSFQKRRCLVVADGFYEWMKVPGGKQPYRLHRRDDKPFAFAGLWDRWFDRAGGGGGDAPPLDTFTILTTDALPEIAAIHHRMPVILDPADFDLWLDPAVADRQRLEPLLTPRGGDLLEAYPVSKLVNSPANDRPECVAPVGDRP
jgi:putative SOS response-associated peptidase YedK